MIGRRKGKASCARHRIPPIEPGGFVLSSQIRHGHGPALRPGRDQCGRIDRIAPSVGALRLLSTPGQPVPGMKSARIRGEPVVIVRDQTLGGTCTGSHPGQQSRESFRAGRPRWVARVLAVSHSVSLAASQPRCWWMDRRQANKKPAHGPAEGSDGLDGIKPASACPESGNQSRERPLRHRWC